MVTQHQSTLVPKKTTGESVCYCKMVHFTVLYVLCDLSKARYCSSADASHDSWLHPSLHLFVLLLFKLSPTFTLCAFF